MSDALGGRVGRDTLKVVSEDGTLKEAEPNALRKQSQDMILIRKVSNGTGVRSVLLQR